ncbi:flagellar type III secretion system protein FliR [Brenneria goodwinii]|uniref:Flagellar biosynthetic protein FliR n=1 Tax=Brenneria goodwinii TaxID=1109412 RepID=A0A0G4K220_9GAMM|nr:flagellar biosynthetic protein FliR [Brenneria goodwinii]MCG8158124.1 flagellar type III secretion system protein FliR [Brenneria goodwinii]MCG8162465.1 flagellar type III secretion system protein FliR [Brenneria goodwinii]MCG8167175.1 flagellar type III secretion system protein FliR [Brenneria goodwinii]MCG8171835.1 flagellar type III secretion system protein FliR [Brenneria goodwinii]MCG8176533.1 flagellar type III secretion system protein FliR [Brenneria goodwinii]
MVEFSSQTYSEWLVQYFWPFVRILALVATAPILSEREINFRVKIGLSLLVTFLIAPHIESNLTPIFSAPGVWLLIQQMIIGIALGLTMQLAFAVFRIAGEVLGLQMGLSFATFFDPSGGPNMPVLARFLNLLAMLLFLTFDGHLWLISLLSDSFHTLPVSGGGTLNSDIFLSIVRAGGMVFINGLMLALPIVTLLLMINLSLGILNRVSPQLSVFVIGFPVTLTVGILTIGMLLPLIPPFAEHIFGEVFDLLANMIGGLAN